MDALALSPAAVDALHEQNWQLTQRLRGSESARRLLERQNRALQRRVQQLETQLAPSQSRCKRSDEREWMTEHDDNVRALLLIICHHEAVREELEREVQQLREKEVAPDAVVKVSRATQTDGSHRGWAIAVEGTKKEPHTLADACVKHRLPQQMPSTSAWCGAPTSQELLARSSALTRPCQSDFRSSVIRRLAHGQPSHRPVVRPLAIPEGDETAECQERLVSPLQDSQTLAKAQNVAEASSPSKGVHHYQALEEQNRRLHERLESQQSLLDQLLSIKLDQISSPPSRQGNRTICGTTASSEKATQSLEEPTTALCSSLELADTSDKLDKQETAPKRRPALHLDPTTASSTPPQPPPRQPHPMSPSAA